jgi:hypothetical protein
VFVSGVVDKRRTMVAMTNRPGVNKGVPMVSWKENGCETREAGTITSDG